MRFSDIPRGAAQNMGATAFRAGVLALTVLALCTYFGFTKANPFSEPYELKALFKSANRLQARSPVRIAGVRVGKVEKVAPVKGGSGLAEVTMSIDRSGLPIRKDATLTIRSRLFLEGNYFVDLHPGKPASDELADGGTIPPNQTAFPVQLSQVFTALQSETREDLQTLLDQYSKSLEREGAEGFNMAIKNWEEAYKNTSQVNDATRGTEEHDLTRVLTGQARVFGALSSNEESLKDLVTDLNDTISGFARQEDNLRATIPELRDVLREGRPALASLDRALPQIRGFARDGLPGARSSLPTLRAQIPFIQQARRLVSRRELGGLSQQLRRTVPFLARLNKRTTRTLAQNRALASCQSNVLLPFAKTPIPDPDNPRHTNIPWFKESGSAFVGLAGESRQSDANSSFFRVQGAGGPTTIVSTGETFEEPLYGQQIAPIDGVRPVRPTKRPVFRPDIPCETQQPPDMNAAGGPGDQSTTANATKKRSRRELKTRSEAAKKLEEFSKASLEGRPALDPFVWFDEGEKKQMKRLGLKRMKNGRLVKVKGER